MPEWIFGGLVALAVSVFGGGGAYVGHVLTRRTSKEATEVQADANVKSNEQVLIDQLQEELTGHRRATDERATAQDARMNRLEEYSDGYRSHAHDLRSHIWDGSPPPPPPWPVGLPK